MEDFAQALQDALGGGVSVKLGAEYALTEMELPAVIVVPSGATYGPPVDGKKDALSSGTRDIRILCKTYYFNESEALADLVYSLNVARLVAPQARLALRSEVWGNYTVRVADLLLTLPTTLTRQDIARVRVLTFTQKVDVLPLTVTPEVVNVRYRPAGKTEYSP